MPVIIKCPHCQQDLDIQPDWAGHSLDCPLCSRSFTAPPIALPAEPVSPPTQGNPSRSRTPYRPPSRGGFKIFLIVLLASGALLGGVWFESWRGPTPRDEAAAQLLEHLAEQL
ncbi:MAG: hypothetical protein ACO3XN_02740, partial [Chthoniobacterales bacterium]